eukprot:CAMPEP_0206584004 /NCGR_PEP_ID=MMETSP0325_2-20121206/35455_1 /ASSEMBLY_ACC=CAM_ASM_000347 /TAXON_ID=2866 /ORGANISM="Crypthecodinium cohnii, Strain Seligo" /LENGTH=570 /DNA_ID=CAMNT_0054091061 /DNA_START=104 /DNA_END=1815 /DNA_ORIENTATION=+
MPTKARLNHLLRRFKLTPKATRAQLKAAYRKQAKVLHPDVAGGTDEKFRALQEEFEEADQLLKGGPLKDGPAPPGGPGGGPGGGGPGGGPGQPGYRPGGPHASYRYYDDGANRYHSAYQQWTQEQDPKKQQEAAQKVQTTAQRLRNTVLAVQAVIFVGFLGMMRNQSSNVAALQNTPAGTNQPQFAGAAQMNAVGGGGPAPIPMNIRQEVPEYYRNRAIHGSTLRRRSSGEGDGSKHARKKSTRAASQEPGSELQQKSQQPEEANLPPPAQSQSQSQQTQTQQQTAATSSVADTHGAPTPPPPPPPSKRLAGAAAAGVTAAALAASAAEAEAEEAAEEDSEEGGVSISLQSIVDKRLREERVADEAVQQAKEQGAVSESDAAAAAAAAEQDIQIGGRSTASLFPDIPEEESRLDKGKVSGTSFLSFLRRWFYPHRNQKELPAEADGDTERQADAAARAADVGGVAAPIDTKLPSSSALDAETPVKTETESKSSPGSDSGSGGTASTRSLSTEPPESTEPSEAPKAKAKAAGGGACGEEEEEEVTDLLGGLPGVSSRNYIVAVLPLLLLMW